MDLLEQLRAALDDVEPLLAGRIVDIEMARLRVSVDPQRFRSEFAALVESVLAESEPAGSITVRVARTGGTARIEVFGEHDGASQRRSMTVSLAAGSSNAADG